MARGKNEMTEPSRADMRHFAPSEAFAAQANAKSGIYEEAAADPVAWWAEQAKSLAWDTPFTKTLRWNEPSATWFEDGTLNASVNCVDRHVNGGRGDKVAFHWIGEPGRLANHYLCRSLSYGLPSC